MLLRQTIIIANRAKANSPVPHNNFSSTAISQIYQAQDIPFLLSSVPSLVETSDAGTGIGYTGMRIRGSDPTRINVTINGIPLNDAESQGVFWVDLPDLAASVSEIQVQRGVGASTNGAGAFGATVNLDLSRVAAEPSAQISNTFGSFGTRKHSAQFGTGLLGGKVAFTGRLSKIASDGYIDRASADLRSYHLSGAYVDDKQTLMLHHLSGNEVTYQAWNGVPAQYIGIDALRRFNTAGTERPGDPYGDEVDNYTQQYWLLHYKRNLAQGLSAQLNGHYTRGFGYYEQYKAAQQFSKYGLPNPILGDSTIESTDLIRQRWLDNDFYGGSFLLRYAVPVNPPILSQVPVFTVGGAVSRYDGQHFGEVIWAQFAPEKNYRYYENDAQKTDRNVFFKTELSFRKGFATFLDLQWRAVSYDFFGYNNNLEQVGQQANLLFFNPKIGFSKRIAANIVAYGFWGIANREPNRDDYTQSTPLSRPKAERLYDTELGVRLNRNNWNLVANGFWMQYRNQLVLDGRINDVGAYVRTNVPQSYRAGVEIEAQGSIGQRLTLAGNLSLSQNKVMDFTEYRDNWDTGGQDAIEHGTKDLAFSPNAISRGEIGFAFLKNRHQNLMATWVGKYVGKQYLDNTGNEQTTLDGYFTTDFRVNYSLKKVIGESVNVVLAVNNLLDARFSSNGWTYRYTSQGYDARTDDPYTRLEGGATFNQTGFFPQAGRNFMATVNFVF